MAFGIKKQAVIAKPSFKERLTGVKSMFKKAHEDAVKRICRYLRGTMEKGIQFDVGNDLTLNCYADADFVDLWRAEDVEDSTCLKSRTGYLITIGNC